MNDEILKALLSLCAIVIGGLILYMVKSMHKTLVKALDKLSNQFEKFLNRHEALDKRVVAVETKLNNKNK